VAPAVSSELKDPWLRPGVLQFPGALGFDDFEGIEEVGANPPCPRYHEQAGGTHGRRRTQVDATPTDKRNMAPTESAVQAANEPVHDRAARLEWSEVAAAHTRALALAETGQVREAVEILREALRRGIDPEPLNNLAVLQYSSGSSDEARDLLRALVHLYPEYLAPAQNLAAITPDDPSVSPATAFDNAAGEPDSGEGGMVYYAKNYDNAGDCPADRDIGTYLDLHEAGDGGLTIFHFGTGAHHHLGLANHRREHPNRVIGVTASPGEYERYMQLCVQDGSLGSDYLVYFGDIYNLRPEYLPALDIASMPHIGEYYDASQVKEPGVHQGGSTDRSYAPLNDRSLVDLIVDKLVVGGRLLIYVRSHGADATRTILHELVQGQGRLSRRMTHESIEVFTKTR
jgi:tetratricopeptide (TPR) repeat protein